MKKYMNTTEANSILDFSFQSDFEVNFLSMSARCGIVCT